MLAQFLSHLYWIPKHNKSVCNIYTDMMGLNYVQSNLYLD